MSLPPAIRAQERLPPALFLMGPTASGKTELALRLVEAFPVAIISVDSVQVYRGLDIGSAKPSADILARVPHRLIDIRDPSEPYSAAEFAADARTAMDEIQAAGQIPLLVGGTGLYFRALVQGLAPLPTADPALRTQLLADGQAQGWPALHQRLANLDPVAAARIHPNDPQRIQRALEVCLLTGRPLSAQQREAVPEPLPYRILRLARAPRDRELLRRRIAERFEQMLVQGLEAEVRQLLARTDLHPGLPSLRSLGYRQMIGYLDGTWTWAQMREQGILATRQFAKRQLTWLRAEPQVHWLFDEEADPAGRAMALVDHWLARTEQSGAARAEAH